MKKIFIVSIVAFLGLTGCARFVTDKTILDSSGNPINPITKEIEFTFTFRGQPALNSNKYYLIVSTSQNMHVAQILQDSYFIVPGDSYDLQKVNRDYYGNDQTKTIQDIYDKFFSSWNNVFIYDANNIRTITPSGPYLSATANYSTRILGGVFNTGSVNQLRFKIPVPFDSFYFQFLAVDNAQMLRESIGHNEPVVYVNGRVQDPITVISNPVADAGLDIVSYNYHTYEY